MFLEQYKIPEEIIEMFTREYKLKKREKEYLVKTAGKLFFYQKEQGRLNKIAPPHLDRFSYDDDVEK
jgi:hypothetical protein